MEKDPLTTEGLGHDYVVWDCDCAAPECNKYRGWVIGPRGPIRKATEDELNMHKVMKKLGAFE